MGKAKFVGTLVSLLLLIFVIIFAVSYNSLLKKQNNILVANIDKMSQRLDMIEVDKTMKKITEFKEENAVLKEQIKALQAELNDLSKKVPQPQVKKTKDKKIQKKTSAGGNAGFLTKNGR